MKKITEALHKSVDTSNAAPTVTPIYQNSAFEAHSDFFYTRKNNPNVEEFEQVINTLENTRYGIATTTGMSAITMVLNLLKPGQTLLINRFLYGCSYKLFQRFCNNFNIRLVIENLTDESNWTSLPKADMVLFETPTNPFLYTVKIQELSDLLKSTKVV